MKKLIATACAAAALVVPASPALADDPLVYAKDCPPGYVGYVIGVVDRDLVRFCIPFGP